MGDFYMKQGDRLPPLKAYLKNPDLSAVDLTNAKVKLHVVQAGGTTAKIDKEANIEGDEKLGLVRYDWAVGDTDIVGEYNFEWEVEFQNGLKETFPNGGHKTLSILAQLA